MAHKPERALWTSHDSFVLVDREVCTAMRSAVDLAAALRRRELSAHEALADALAAADTIPAAFALRLDERARAAAAAADAQLARGEGGALCGVPVTVKDSHWVAGVPTTFASLAVEPLIPVETVAAVRRLEEAGAVIFAKTATPEFCYAGTTPGLGNPHDETRTPGGSSGGAAVAVASGAGPLALGGDGGGSIRIPAAFCGVVGFKPTFGAVPREPSGAGWKTLVAYGPLARSVADARLLFSALAGRDPLDRHSLDVDHAVGGLRFAACDTLGGVDDDVRAVFRSIAGELGAVWDRPAVEPSGATWATIATAEARWSEAEPFEQRPHLLGDSARAFLAAGDAVTTGVYIRAQVQRERIHRAYADLFTRSGLLLTPTVGCEAFPREATGPAGIPDWGAFLFDANLAGLPACAIPMGVGDDGLPVSLQITGPRGQDGAVLAAAEHIEELLHVARYV
jgi:Asp-tRNA(Asn)/Glu-tRNA(Gln) amidotransferase A subunit family amidase